VLFRSDSEIAAILETYRESPEKYYWNRELRGDLDSIVVYRVKRQGGEMSEVIA